jgi:[ribulose-bisphosphate carboxylase]/[fructose-bisphosphate aldolase]-lysine N-methyltransferase
MFLSPAGTQLLSTTMGVKDYVQGEFDSVQAEIINANKDLFPESVTCDDFLWAFGVLRSRVFPELRGEKLALIPFADLVSSECKICPSIVTM